MRTPLRTRRGRAVGWGFGVAALLFAATACGAAGGTSSGDGVAAAANTGTLTSSSSATDRTQAATAFTDCMRANGVPDFPGVTIDQDGNVHLSLSGKSVDPISDTYRKAAQTCGHFLPSGSTLPAEPPTPKVDGPSLNLSCTGDYCPKAPAAPAPPR